MERQLPQLIYERRKRAKETEVVKCFPQVEEFLRAKEVICQRVRLQRTFLHLHQDVGPATKKRKKQAAVAQPGEVPAWETYMQVNGFRPGCQLVQTFLWHCAEDLLFACVPYPLRPDAALLAEALKVPTDRLIPCKLREVQNITKMPLFICLPFALPKVKELEEQLKEAMKLLAHPSRLHDTSSRDGECVVCMAQPRRYAFTPCGHRCVCHLCAVGVCQSDRRCPICRAKVVRMLRIIDA